MTVSIAPLLLQMKDSFYEVYQLPKLPLPVYLTHPAEPIEKGEVRFALITDNLCKYLSENPDKVVQYMPIVAKMAHEAGVHEGRQSNFHQANQYLKIAKHFRPLDLMILADLARSYLDLGVYNDALLEYQAIMKVLGAEGFSPEVWLAVAHVSFQMGKKKKGQTMVDEYRTKVKEFYPDQARQMFTFALEWSLRNDAHPSMIGLFLKYVKR